MADFADRVALVTGGGSGIGQACVQQLAAAGARVLAADRDDAALKATVEGTSGQVATALGDVCSPEFATAMVDAAVCEFGRLDIAVNAAGVSGTYANTADQEVEEWRRVIEINLTSVFLSMRAEIPALLTAGGGSIVNIASAAGSMGVPGLAHYSASKHGVIGLTKSAALEYARSGLRINAVLPGLVRTPMLQRFAGGDEAIDKLGRGAPVGRAAEPDEIAAAVLWLSSPEASYVTGHTMAVDGGALAT